MRNLICVLLLGMIFASTMALAVGEAPETPQAPITIDNPEPVDFDQEMPFAHIASVVVREDAIQVEVDANHDGWQLYASNVKYGYTAYSLTVSDVQITDEFTLIYESEEGFGNHAEIPLTLISYGPSGEQVETLVENVTIVFNDNQVDDLGLNIPEEKDEYPNWMTPKIIEQVEAKKEEEARQAALEAEANAIPFPVIYLKVMTSQEAVAQAILAEVESTTEYIYDEIGVIKSGSQDITPIVAEKFCHYLAAHPECIYHKDEVLRRAAYIFNNSRRHCTADQVFFIADESQHYIETHPGTAFGNNWERAMRVIAAESGFRYWIRYKGPRRSNASGLWQFLSSTADWFAAEEMQRVVASINSNNGGNAEERAGVLTNMLWATNGNLAFGLMNPVTASHNNNTTPTISSNRTEAFQRLVTTNMERGMSEGEAFSLAQEQVIRYQLQMGARLLDQKPNGWWSQWEVCTVYGV